MTLVLVEEIAVTVPNASGREAHLELWAELDQMIKLRDALKTADRIDVVADKGPSGTISIRRDDEWAFPEMVANARGLPESHFSWRGPERFQIDMIGQPGTYKDWADQIQDEVISVEGGTGAHFDVYQRGGSYYPGTMSFVIALA